MYISNNFSTAFQGGKNIFVQKAVKMPLRNGETLHIRATHNTETDAITSAEAYLRNAKGEIYKGFGYGKNSGLEYPEISSYVNRIEKEVDGYYTGHSVFDVLFL